MCQFPSCDAAQKRKGHHLGVRLRGRTATQRSKKGSEKVLEKVLGKGSQNVLRRGPAMAFAVKKGSQKGL